MIWTDKEKCRSLTKQYSKWKGQTTHKDPKRKKRAKEMIKAIADLRKQYLLMDFLINISSLVIILMNSELI